jgi:hypothetical protein
LRREAWTLPRERTDWLEACHNCTVLASTLGVKNETMQYIGIGGHKTEPADVALKVCLDGAAGGDVLSKD